MKHRRSERGVALIICLFALMLLSGIGLGMMYMADTETSINSNYRDSQKAYFAAVAGLQEVRERLMPSSAASLSAAGMLPTALPGGGTATGITYVVNPNDTYAASAIQPWLTANTFFDTEFCHENFTVAGGGSPLVTNTGANSPCLAFPSGTPKTTTSNLPSDLLGTSANLAYRWVRITQKSNWSAVPDPNITPVTGFYVGSKSSTNYSPVCWDSTSMKQSIMPAGYANCEAVPSATGLTTVYVLTALAVTPAGSRRMAQMEVANDAPFLTNAALDTNDFVTINGASVTVNGFDNCKCTCTVGKGNAAPTCNDRTTGAACTGNTYAIYSSQTVDKSGALVAGTTPAVAENQVFPYDVLALINRYKSQPGAVNVTGAPYYLTCTGTLPTANCGQLNNGTLGTAPNPFPPTDPTNPAGAVNQITYVPGSFDIQAKTSGAGILIIDGDLTIHGGLNFYGLIIVRGVLTFSGSGSGQNVGVLGSIITGNSSIADDSLKGGVNVQYDRCALLSNTNTSPPRVLSAHEVSY
jgi:hypothetical protein